jgi:acyl-CoA hydrolase
LKALSLNIHNKNKPARCIPCFPRDTAGAFLGECHISRDKALPNLACVLLEGFLRIFKNWRKSNMESKTAKDSAVIMSHVMLPEDANPSGNILGGVIMKHIDTTATVVGMRHARCNAVTASVDRLDFHYPAYVGNLLTLKGSINMVGRTSMEIGVRAETEDLLTGKIRKIASAYLTLVGLDETGHTKELPRIIFKTEEEKRRNTEAIERRESRLREKKKKKKS